MPTVNIDGITVITKADEVMKDLIPKSKNFQKYCVKLNAIYLPSGNKCPGAFEIKDTLAGEGTNKVYQVCCSDVCDYVGKWTPADGKFTGEPTNEVMNQIKASKMRIAPKIHMILSCSAGEMIIMDSLYMTFYDKIFNFSKEQMDYTISYIDLLLSDRPPLDKMKLNLNRLVNFQKTPDVRNSRLVFKEIKYITGKINDHCDKNGQSHIPPYECPKDTPNESKEKLNSFNSCLELIYGLHLGGMLHNDAHTENFMCDKLGQWYIIDFGRATILTKQLLYQEHDYDMFFRNTLELVLDQHEISEDFIRGMFTSIKNFVKKRKVAHSDSLIRHLGIFLKVMIDDDPDLERFRSLIV